MRINRPELRESDSRVLIAVATDVAHCLQHPEDGTASNQQSFEGKTTNSLKSKTCRGKNDGRRTGSGSGPADELPVLRELDELTAISSPGNTSKG